MRYPFLLVFLAFLALTRGAEAHHTACLLHDIAVEKLKNGWSEHRIGLGVSPSNNEVKAVLELFVSKTGTWTILVTRPNGLSCIAASGDSWMSSPFSVDVSGVPL